MNVGMGQNRSYHNNWSPYTHTKMGYCQIQMYRLCLKTKKTRKK